MSEQETAEYYDFLLKMERIEFKQELIDIVSINFVTSISIKSSNYH